MTELPQFGDDIIEILHEYGEVLAQVGRWLSFDEVELLPAGVEPGAPKPKVGPVIPSHQAEWSFVELEGMVEIVDVDGHMVNGERFHDGILADQQKRVGVELETTG